METFELVKELSTKSKVEIQYALLTLMLQDKIDFIDLSNTYVEYLKNIEEDNLDKLIEAETCVMEGFFDKITKDKKETTSGERNYNHTQRCLYLLNQSKRFQMESLNKKYNYDEEHGKSMSWYERNKYE